MSKIYILIVGHYSDAYNHLAYSTKEEAYNAIKEFNRQYEEDKPLADKWFEVYRKLNYSYEKTVREIGSCSKQRGYPLENMYIDEVELVNNN